jgi:hypothetical protein
VTPIGTLLFTMCASDRAGKPLHDQFTILFGCISLSDGLSIAALRGRFSLFRLFPGALSILMTRIRPCARFKQQGTNTLQ